MNQEAAAFTYLWEKFPRLSEAKFEEGIFIGPQIRDFIKDKYFDKLLQGNEKYFWETGSKLWGACKQPFVELPEIRLQHVTKNTLRSLAFGFFSRRIVVKWVMNMESVSIEIFLQWRRDIKGNGTVLCSWTTAGLWQWMPLPWNTSDRQNEKESHFVCVK